MKYIFIVGIFSGGGEQLPVILDIQDAFIREGKGGSFITEYVTKAEEVRPLALAYSEKYGSGCVIFICGDNGAVHEAAAALAETETPLGIIPMDEDSCDLASKIYSGKTTAHFAAETLGLLSGSPKFKIRRIDMGMCCGEYFVNSVTMGLDGAAVKYAEKLPERLHGVSDKLGFAAAVLGDKRFKLNASLHLVKEINGRVRRFTVNREMSFMYAAVTNSGYCGSYCPSKYSVLNDGIFEMLLVLPGNFAEVFALLPMYRKGVADAAENVKLLTVRGAEFSSAEGSGFTVSIDGKYRNVSSADISVKKKALKICTSIFM